MVLPNPGVVAPEAVIPEPPLGHEWIYPYSVAPHYHSQNAGPWCAETLRADLSQIRPQCAEILGADLTQISPVR
jgi:hypothetical protein